METQSFRGGIIFCFWEVSFLVSYKHFLTLTPAVYILERTIEKLIKKQQSRSELWREYVRRQVVPVSN